MANFKKSYFCDKCKYYSDNLTNYQKHLLSKNHIENMKDNPIVNSNIKKIKIFCCDNCDKVYKSKRSLEQHKIKCYDKKKISLLEENNKMLIEQNEILKKEFNKQIIKENKNLTKITDSTLTIAKDNSKTISTSMSILKYANLHLKDVEPLETPNNETILKVIGYKNPKNNESKNEIYVKTAIHQFNHHIFHSFIGDMIVEYYKPKNTNGTNVIATDTSRLCFIIMQKITKGKKEQKEWINDKSGKKFTELVLTPVIDAVKCTLIEFVEFKKTKELNESNLCLMAKCIELKRDIEVQKFTNQILKYVAPHFHFDNLKLLNDTDSQIDDYTDSDNYIEDERMKPKIKIKKNE